MDMAFAKRRQFVAAYLIETWMNCLSNAFFVESFFQRWGVLLKFVNMKGFLTQKAKMPRDTSPHQLMYLLSPLSKSHEMLGDRGDTQIPTKMC